MLEVLPQFTCICKTFPTIQRTVFPLTELDEGPGGDLDLLEVLPVGPLGPLVAFSLGAMAVWSQAMSSALRRKVGTETGG